MLEKQSKNLLQEVMQKQSPLTLQQAIEVLEDAAKYWVDVMDEARILSDALSPIKTVEQRKMRQEYWRTRNDAIERWTGMQTALGVLSLVSKQ